jgi:hypothetical protein
LCLVARARLDDPLTEALLRTGRHLRRGTVSADLRTITKAGGREADAFYRDLGTSEDAYHAARFGFQLHVMLAWVLFAAWPFTGLVHVFSAPLGYLTRPYIVYRSRDAARQVPRGWEPVGTPDRR